MIKENLNELKANIVLILSAITVGLITSIVTQIFAFTAKKIFNLLKNSKDFEILDFSILGYEGNTLPIFSCVFAAFCICILIKFFKIERWYGPADTIYAAHQNAGTLNIKRGFQSTLAAFFSISGGASVGIYGPLVHFGGTLGAFLRRLKFMPNIPHDVVIGAGVAAAISAGFSSPIAGIIFAHEVVLRHFSLRAIATISLASISSSILAQEMNFVSPPLQFINMPFELYDAIPGLILTGFFSALVAFIFMKSLLYHSKISSSLHLPFCYRPFIPAIICGVIGIFLPQVMGLGSETISSLITTIYPIQFLLLLLILKIFLSSLCIGFGLFGGVLSPAMLIGVCCGAIIYNLSFFGDNESLNAILAISGMAAVSSSVIGAPITAIVLVFELTGSYNYAIASIFPIALSNLITYLMFGLSFFDAQLKSRNINMGFGREYFLMEQTKISEFVNKDFLSLHINISASKAITQFKKHNVTEAYFKDENDVFLGKLKIIDIINVKNSPAINYIDTKCLTLKPTNNITESIKKLSNFVGESVPIINKDKKIIGIISENDVLKAYEKITNEIRIIEKN